MVGLAAIQLRLISSLRLSPGGGGWPATTGPRERSLRDTQRVRHAGEEHEAGTDTGLTAIVVEGSFDVWAAGVTTEIIVSDYDPAWPEWFERVCDKVWPAVSDIALRIDHVGSTSVPGLAAKPVIDTDIVVASDEDVQPVVERLESIGYRWRGDLGVEGRQAFKPVDEEGLPRHHLYLVVEGSKAHLDHVLLRDLLREDPERAEKVRGSQADQRDGCSGRHGRLYRSEGFAGCRTAHAGAG